MRNSVSFPSIARAACTTSWLRVSTRPSLVFFGMINSLFRLDASPFAVPNLLYCNVAVGTPWVQNFEFACNVAGNTQCQQTLVKFGAHAKISAGTLRRRISDLP